jgi:c(7)-type cytochrome triheme protein
MRGLLDAWKRRLLRWPALAGSVARPRAALAVLALLALAAVSADRWLPLERDGIHDPASPAVAVLQQPAEALGVLPPDTAGNKVKWVQALDEGKINPRTNINPETKVDLRTTEILLRNTGEMPMVKFPHRQHTEWLDCSNCHDQLFAQKAGATKINMLMVLQGEKCGLCHGAVSFPLTECVRCHSVPRGSEEAKSFGKTYVKQP